MPDRAVLCCGNMSCSHAQSPGAGCSRAVAAAGLALAVVLWGCGDDRGAAEPFRAQDGGSEPAVASFNVAPNASCEFSVVPEEAVFLDHGLYDIERAAESDGTPCRNPYLLHLQVVSFLGSTGGASELDPNRIELHEAEVLLTTLDDEPLAFDRAQPALANPFRVPVSGVLPPTVEGARRSRIMATVEAIPLAYAARLGDQAGDEILVSVRLRGATAGGTTFELAPFRYLIELCAGCLIDCASAPIDAEPSRCEDNAGVDGRLCHDPDC